MKTIYYHSIPVEFKRLGITKPECAKLLGCSLNALTHRIKRDQPTLHWAIYGIANYLDINANVASNLQHKTEANV